MKNIIDFLKKLIEFLNLPSSKTLKWIYKNRQTCLKTAFVKNGNSEINFADMKDLKSYFTPFILQCLNLSGVEDCAGVDRGTIKKLLAGKKISDEDLKMLSTVIRMIKNS